jgi:hypothetical protein
MRMLIIALLILAGLTLCTPKPRTPFLGLPIENPK